MKIGAYFQHNGKSLMKLTFSLKISPLLVPLWLAIHLRKQQKCRIVPPAWMERDILEEIKEAEKRMK